MSLPPQLVRIKRKKEEDPVDTLYIEKHQQQKKRRVTDFVFRRVTEDFSIHGRRSFSREVPSVRTSKPGDELTGGLSIRPSKEPNDKSLPSIPPTKPAPPLFNEEEEDSLESKAPRRRFLLTTSKSISSFPLRSDSGITKRRKKSDKAAVATFVEKSARPKSHQKKVDSMSRGVSEALDKKGPAPAVEPAAQKKPNASAVEKAWRAKQWGTSPGSASNASPGSAPPKEPPPNAEPPPNIVAQMQEMVLEELSRVSNDIKPHASPAKSKIRPKVPAQRYADRNPESKASEDAPISQAPAAEDTEMDSPSDGEYVFDLFVREPGHTLPSSSTTGSSSLPKEDDNFGLLVITEDNISEWESYVFDGEESEKDYNTDEDDENAEDYFANDYPDDEVDIDDEYGHGSYNYGRRHGGKSDSEEFDADDDEEWNDAGSPWEREPPELVAEGGH